MQKSTTFRIQPVMTVGLLLIMAMLSGKVSAIPPADNHGFRLIKKRFVKELNADCYFYEHIKSGAHLVKIAVDDPNKTFCIAFKTFPESDNGAPHILEHSVLNGSTHFPVKSPFDVLRKGSLNTFLNAMTSKDFTMFPVASMNDKDYFNLMHVYLDAVFNPLLCTDSRILQQEGWHYELPDKDSPVTYNGVVYNEMKGAYSSPTRELSYQAFKNLFPDNAYGFESGGHPSTIPTLTQEAFVKFYKRYYHPENSYIFLYGDGNLDKELEFIDKEYLSGYTKTGKLPVITDQKAFTAMKEATSYYSVMEGSDTTNKTYLSLNIVAGHNTDQALCMSLDLLCDLLVNQESAPIRLALQKAGIGQDVSAYSNNYKQNVIQIIVQNANASDKQKFYDIVMNTLKDVAKKGLDKQAMEGVLNRMEFQLREGNDAQKGLTYIYQSQPGFFFANDPFLGLEYEKPLAEVKTALTTNYLEKVMEKYLINNPHSLLLMVAPKPGLDKENNAKMEAQLKAYKTSLSEDALNALVKQTQNLIAFQKQEDTPEALATIPMLDIKDIDTQAKWYSLDEKEVNGNKVLFHDEFTNNVVYTNLFFDLHAITTDLLPYAELLSNVLDMLGTEKYSYGELDKALNIHTGGFGASLNSYLENLDDDLLVPKFVVTTKALNTKVDKMFELTSEILYKARFTDIERLKNILIRHQSQLDARVKRNGNVYASTRLSSYFTNSGMFDELTSGLEYYWFVTDLVNNFDKNSSQISASLAKVASLLFTKDNMIAATTCSAGDLPAFSHGLESLIKIMPATTTACNMWEFKLEKKNEGLLTSSKVQYVIEGYNFKKLGYQWNGKMRVLNQVISTDWLQTRVRVIGGAYGGYSSFSPTGLVTFNSYRDPNLKETLDNYKGTPDYLSKFEADPKLMTRYIIGTVASMDRPLTPSGKGSQAVSMYFTKRTLQDIQRDRDAVLSTTPADIRNFSKMVSDVLTQQTYCVYGNSDKLNANKELFNSLLKIER